MILKVIYGQTLMDIAIEQYGDARALLDLAKNNGLAPDADIFPGQELLIISSANSIPVFADYLVENKIKVVSGQGGDNEPFYLLATNDDEVLADNNDNILQR